MAAGDEQESQPEIIIEADQLAGVWANFAQVSHSPYEFTLDFVRLDFSSQQPRRGIVVARISVSPLFIDELIRALQTNWKLYARKALPQEVYRERDSDEEAEGQVPAPSEERKGDDDEGQEPGAEERRSG
jgi:hypothetical protein